MDDMAAVHKLDTEEQLFYDTLDLRLDVKAAGASDDVVVSLLSLIYKILQREIGKLKDQS